MKNFKEFRERFESDAAFREKCRSAENEEQLLAITKTEGYDLEQLDEEDLDAIAGGSFNLVTAAENGVKYLADKTDIVANILLSWVKSW